VLCLTVNYWWLNIQGDSGGKISISEVIISVIVGEKKVHINTCITVIQLAESPYLTLLDFCLWGWIKGEVHKRKVDTRDKLLAGSSDVATRIKKREDQLRRTTRDLRTEHAKCIEIDGGIFGHLL